MMFELFLLNEEKKILKNLFTQENHIDPEPKQDPR